MTRALDAVNGDLREIILIATGIDIALREGFATRFLYASKSYLTQIVH